MALRIGLIGCGRWGANILRDLLSLDCEVTVADPDPVASAKATQAGAKAVASLQDLPDNLDGFVVAVPTSLHFEVVSQLLGYNRPIFCEKPLTADLEQARILAAKAPEQIFVMDKWRYHPGVEALRQIVAQATLGQVQLIRTRRVQWGHPHRDVDGVWILAPHDLSIVAHILGTIPPPRAAFGEFVGEQLQGITAFLGTTPGAVIEVSARQPVANRLVSVACETGVAVLDESLADHIKLYRNGLSKHHAPEILPISTEMPLWLELRQFCQFLQGGAPPLTTAADAVHSIEVITILRQLAREAR
ncbi:MAG: Gfo/Idh/MocA family oxidoreductase [Elainella sp. C42_A2020_010]|nr:Gfo/Idh/MocA family oxidoreductase [Elainella sp. C42_A2020_010]